MRTNTTLITAGPLAALALYWSLARGEPPAPPPPRQAPDLFAFVPSMEGTRPDGNVTVATDDALVIDAELGHLFDYYLAGIGEKPLAAIRSWNSTAAWRRRQRAKRSVCWAPTSPTSRHWPASNNSCRRPPMRCKQHKQDCKRSARCAPRISRRRKAPACSARKMCAMTTPWRA